MTPINDGKINYHISDLYIALFNHFIPCGAYEGVYILDPFYQNKSDIQPDTVHADTHGHTVTWTHLFQRSALGGRRGRQAGQPGRCGCGFTASARTTDRSWSDCSMTTASLSRSFPGSSAISRLA